MLHGVPILKTLVSADRDSNTRPPIRRCVVSMLLSAQSHITICFLSLDMKVSTVDAFAGLQHFGAFCLLPWLDYGTLSN